MPQQPITHLDDSGNPVSELDDSGNPIGPTSSSISPTTPVAPQQSILGRAWDFLNTSPITGRQATPMGEFARKLMDPATGMRTVQEEGLTQATTPLSIGGELLGGLGAFKGASRIGKLFGKGGEVAQEVAPEVSAATKPGLDKATVEEMMRNPPKGVDFSRYGNADELINSLQPLPIKPRVRVNLDGTFTNLDTGEVLNPKAMMNRPFEPDVPIRATFKGTGKKLPSTINEPPSGPVPPDLPPPKKDFYKDPIHNEPGKVQQIYDLTRGMMSVDLPYVTSAAFRQAGPMVGTKYWWRGWVNSAKAFHSEDLAAAINKNINEMPLIKRAIDPESGQALKSYADKVGLQLTDLDTGINSREEALRGQLAEKIPVYGKYVRASNRAYTAFLNTVRAGSFHDLVDGAKASGLDPEKDLTAGKAIADFVNDATGRGSLTARAGKLGEVNLERHTRLLSNLLFSPRGVAAKIHMIGGTLSNLAPESYAFTPTPIRRQYLWATLRQVGTWWGMAGLAELGGASVSKNPTSADFGKIKIGNTRIDPPGGLQQYLVLGARMAAGGTTSTTSPSAPFEKFGKGGPYDPTYGSTLEQFGENRLHPTLKMAVDLLTATKKQPFHTLDKSIQALAPMYADDIAQIAQQDPNIALMLGGGLASSVGMGTQSYERGSFGKPTFTPLLGLPDMNIPSRR